MELRPSAGVERRASVYERYLALLSRKRSLPTSAIASRGSDAIGDLLGSLAGARDGGDDPAYASIGARLRLAGIGDAPIVEDARRGVCLVSTPPIRRSTMAPMSWRERRLAAALRRRGARPGGPSSRGRWHRIAALRRSVLLALVLGQTYLATTAMADVLPYHGTKPLEIAQLVLFAILIGWISAGFWTAMAGFLLRLRGHDPSAISASALAPFELDESARTAIVMPICNEDVARVFAGLRATYRSIERTGKLGLFDFFVLSDTSDPDARVAERSAWLDLCRRHKAFGRVFYRLRQHRIKRKSGNIADFCRRWGKNYRYMVVLDADSVMSGRCLVELVRLMEANADAGIIQTAPHASGRETMYARIQQFAARVYGPLFVAGMHYWQLGEAHYWGHNAIIRVEPFIRHCALARLPGRGTLSGEILSHDFVEAALMRRAGWGVWIAYDLPGSYEEMPPNLIDELTRDRRWCQGNLINSRLFFAHGLHPAHRAVFVTGVMAYASAPLWFAFLVLSTAALAVHTLIEPTYFVAPRQLFPLWPQWHPDRAIGLFGATAALLFVPKVLGVAFAAVQDSRRFGGVGRLATSAFGEFVFSALLAPIRMLFHTEFVLGALSGFKIAWKSPPRDDSETHWGEALRRHGSHSLLGVAWAAFTFWLNPAFLWWLAPVAGALMLSIPLSVFSSRVSFGRRLREQKLFLIPEESRTPRALRRMRRYLRHSPPLPDFIDVVVDPLANAIACASDAARAHHSDAVRASHGRLVERALRGGPGSLRAEEKLALLGDAVALARLHYAVWTRADAAPAWHAHAASLCARRRRAPRKTAPRLPRLIAAKPDSIAVEPGMPLPPLPALAARSHSGGFDPRGASP